MKIMHIVSTLAAIVAVACVSATVTEPSACSTADLGTLPATPVAGVQLPPQTFTSSFDFSGTINKVTDVADSIQASISNLMIHNVDDMSWLQSVQVAISSNVGNAGAAALAHYAASSNNVGNDITLTIDMDDATLLGFLKQPFTLTFTVAGTTVTHSVVLNDTMCVAIVGKVTKSI